MQREFLQYAHGALYLDISFLALDTGKAQTIGIFCCSHADNRSRVLHEQCPTGIDAVPTQVAGIADDTWRTEKADGEAEIVDVQVAQTASRLLGVEDGCNLTLQVTVIPTAVLRVATIHHAYGSQLGKQVAKLSEHRHVE